MFSLHDLSVVRRWIRAPIHGVLAQYHRRARYQNRRWSPGQGLHRCEIDVVLGVEGSDLRRTRWAHGTGAIRSSELGATRATREGERKVTGGRARLTLSVGELGC